MIKENTMTQDEIAGRLLVAEIVSAKKVFSPINGWTKEKIIDQIWAKNNGKASFDEREDACAYVSGDDGNRCAVGCFIPDELYNEDMEGFSLTGLLQCWPKLKERMPLGEVGLRTFQMVHDCLKDYDDVSPDIRVPLQHWIENNVA